MKDQKKDNKGSDENESERDPKDNRPLPGEYPPEEDIMNRLNRVERVGIDPDNLSRNPGANNNISEDESENELPGTEIFPPTTNKKKGASESDLTKEDYEALGPEDLSMDGGDDEQLKHRVWPVDFAARDLDVPNGDGERRDTTGLADEENDHYSLGGDDKDSLEDDPTRTFG